MGTKPSKAATEAAEKILATIYGEDLSGCTVGLESISEIVQSGIDAEGADYRALSEALIGAIRQIQAVATPPAKEEITSREQLSEVLGQRADAIRVISSKILEAWESLESKRQK